MLELIFFFLKGGGGSLVFTPVHFAVKERISVYCVTQWEGFALVEYLSQVFADSVSVVHPCLWPLCLKMQGEDLHAYVDQNN